MGDDTSISTMALDAFVELSQTQAAQLDALQAEISSLRQRVINLSPDHAVTHTVLDQIETLASRWRSTHVFVEQVLAGTVGADQPGGVTPAPTGPMADATALLGRLGPAAAPWTLGDEEPEPPETYPHDPDRTGLRQITPIPDDLGGDVEIHPKLEGGPEILVTPPADPNPTERQITPRVLDEIEQLAAKRRAAQPPPQPTGPIPKPADPDALIPFNGRTYPRHELVFTPARTPDGEPRRDPRTGQPLYDVRLLGTGGTQVISDSIIEETDWRDWHLDVENPAPGVRAGQLHLQYTKGGRQMKFYYDFENDRFLPDRSGAVLPTKKEKDVRSDAAFQAAIERARTRLNVPQGQS